MANTLMSLLVAIGADTSGLVSGLDDSKRMASSTASGISGSLSSVGDSMVTIGKIGLAAVTAVGVGIVALGLKSFSAAARVDELRVVVGVLADNAGISRDSVEAVAEAIHGQGIESAIAYQAVAQLMRSNIDLASASDLARVAQDAAVISGMNSTDTYNMMIDGIVKMNPEILRTAGITMDANIAYDNFAESIGKTAEELTVAEKQQAFLNAVLDAGVPIAGAYAAAMEEPGKVLRSFPRYFNDIFVAIGKNLKPALGGVVMGMAKFLKGLGAAVSEGGAFSGIIKKITDFLTPMAEAFGEWIGSIDFEQVAKSLEGPVDSIIGGIQWMLDTLKGFYDLIKNDNGYIVALVTTLGIAIAAAAWTAITPMLPLIAAFALVAAAVYLLYKAWTNNWGGIQEKTAAALADIKSRWDIFIAGWNAGIAGWVSFGAGFAAKWEEGLAGWQTFFAGIKLQFDTFKLSWDAGLLGWQSFGDGFAVKWAEGLVGWQTFFAGVKGQWDTFKVAWDAGIAGWAVFGEGIKGALDGINSAIQDTIAWFTSMAEKISSLTLPDWLTPGSPTPFEMGLRGINDALKTVSATGLPDMSAQFGTAGGDAGAGGITGATAPVIDYEELGRVVARAMTSALSRTEFAR